MESIAQFLGLSVPSLGQVDWDTQLDDLVPVLPNHEFLLRRIHPEHPEYAPGCCPRRSAIARARSTESSQDCATKLSFCEGRLCSVCRMFATTELNECEYYARVESIRRRATAAMGVPIMRRVAGWPAIVSYRWRQAGMHVELASESVGGHRLRLTANNPDICDWCSGR